jgi:hypothetical protein
MKTHQALCGLVSGLLLLAAGTSNTCAALVSVDLNGPGDNLLTQDTISGLVWLDLTQTTNQSFNSVFAQLGSGGTFEGFRYATLAEVAGLWQNAGIDTSSLPGGAFTSANYTPILNLQNLIGFWPSTATNQLDSVGMVSDTDGGANHEIPFIRRSDTTNQGTPNSGNYLDPDTAQANRASWLVQVPEPSSTLLSVVALAAAMLRRRRS